MLVIVKKTKTKKNKSIYIFCPAETELMIQSKESFRSRHFGTVRNSHIQQMLHTETITAQCLLLLMAIDAPELHKLSFFFFLRLIRLVRWWWKPMGALTSYKFPCWWIERERSLVLKLQEPSAASGADYPQPLPQGAVALCTRPVGTLNLCSARDQSHSTSASQNCCHQPLLCLPQDKFY